MECIISHGCMFDELKSIEYVPSPAAPDSGPFLSQSVSLSLSLSLFFYIYVMLSVCNSVYVRCIR